MGCSVDSSELTLLIAETLVEQQKVNVEKAVACLESAHDALQDEVERLHWLLDALEGGARIVARKRDSE